MTDSTANAPQVGAWSVEPRAEHLVEALRLTLDEAFQRIDDPEPFAKLRELTGVLVATIASGRHAFRRTTSTLEASEDQPTRSALVGVYSIGLGRQLGLSAEFQRRLGEGALLHDLGEALVPPEILSKPGPFDGDEWQVVKQHPQVGADLLSAHGSVNEITRWAVLGHHERLDGGGYPYGLRGGEVALPARIVALADVYVALTTQRPHRPALRSFDALGIMRTEMLSGLDRELFRELVVLLARDDDAW